MIISISFSYSKYDTNFKQLDEKSFYIFSENIKLNPLFKVYEELNIFKLFKLFIIEFWLRFLILFILGFAILIFYYEPYIWVTPFCLWLIFGGGKSIYNFFENIFYTNRFHKKLNLKFSNFKSYYDYLNYFKYEKL